MKLLELKTPKIQVSSQILAADKPDYVYLLLPKNPLLLVHANSIVQIGSPLFKSASSTVTSPVSGIVKQIVSLNNQTFLEIANDFTEKKLLTPAIKKSFKNLNPEILSKLLLKEFNLDFSNIKHLVLNCIDDEPYVLTEYYYLFLNSSGYLEILDKLVQVYHLDSLTIVLKANNTENISSLMQTLGMYPSIKLTIVPNLYLLGKEPILLDYLNLPKSSTKVISASAFYPIYNLLKRNRQKSDLLLTISGDALVTPKIARVKIGTKLSDVLSNIEIKSACDPLYFANGLMSGTIINPQDLIVTSSLNSILIMKPKKIPQKSECINCGACLNICPVNLNPKLLNSQEYREKKASTCLNCGLCSYICPVYINFNEYLKGEHHA